MRRGLCGLLMLSAIAVVILLGCGGGGTQPSSNSSAVSNGTVMITGSDAPLLSVLAFKLNIDSLSLSTGSSSAQVATEGSIEFSRLLGLRTLIGMDSVPPGTYTSATLQVSSPVISTLDVTTTPASVATINGTLTRSTITVALNPPLVVSSSGMGALHLHLNIRNSLLTDSSGQLTGEVNPAISMRVLGLNDPDAEVDELLGGVSSVDVANSKFVLQTPHGRLITVRVNNQTNWIGTDTLNTIAPPTTLEISGTALADGTLLADSVEVISHDAAIVGGLVLNVSPASGPADNFTLLVRTEIPVISGISVPGTGTVNVNNLTAFVVRNFNLPVSSYLFNASMLVLGQRVYAGGVINTSTTPNSINARRVVLRRQGLDGMVVANSVVVQSGNSGSFQLANNGLFGYILGGPLKILTSNATRFVNLSGLADVSNVSGQLRVVGLVLKDPNTLTPVLVAGYVEKLTSD